MSSGKIFINTDEFYSVSRFLALQQTVDNDNSLCGVSPEMLVGGMQELAVF